MYSLAPGPSARAPPAPASALLGFKWEEGADSFEALSPLSNVALSDYYLTRGSAPSIWTYKPLVSTYPIESIQNALAQEARNRNRGPGGKARPGVRPRGPGRRRAARYVAKTQGPAAPRGAFCAPQ